MHRWFLALLIALSASSHANEIMDDAGDSGQIRVVASIKPVHSLVAGIMQGAGRPELLLGSNQSPHHYSLRPSERRKLTRADVIFWIGPNMESFMPRLLHSLDKKTRLVSLINTEGLKLLPLRSTNHHTQRRAQTDAHIWLSTANVEKMLDEITRQLISIDPDNTRQYQHNNQRLHKSIITLRSEINSLLKDKQNPFLTYHDGYQYFEREFNLNNAGLVSIKPELRPSARHIQDLKELIHDRSIQCVFYDAPFEPPIMVNLLAGSGARAIALDPSGINLAAGKDTWSELMQALGHGFQNCL